MKYGIREICDVVLKAKAPMKIGHKIFYKDEPVMYFDTLKTSTLEGASTTVYAQGGRGNARLVSWDGEKTLTFTMEDALISPEGLMILAGAGLIEADSSNTIKQHVTETTSDFTYNPEDKTAGVTIYLSQKPYMGPKNGGAYLKQESYVYVMAMKNGEVVSEPYLPVVADPVEVYWDGSKWANVKDASETKLPEKYAITIQPKSAMKKDASEESQYNYVNQDDKDYKIHNLAEINDEYLMSNMFVQGVSTFLVDYYTEKASNAKQIEITAESFGGNFYLEASTLFRNQDGVDLPAEFIIPNCKVQSNFTFSMASSGDPSTFTFTLDAFPGYTRFDSTKKVMAAIQVIEDVLSTDMVRTQTFHEPLHENSFVG